MNSYILLNNSFLKLNGTEKVNEGVFLDKDRNVIPIGKLTVGHAYTMYDLKKDIKEINEINYKQLAKKYGMHVYYSDDEEKRIYLVYFDFMAGSDFIIDIAEKRLYDISSFSKNIFDEHYFICEGNIRYLLEDYDCEPEYSIKILNIDSEINLYKHYKNVNVIMSSDIIIVGNYYGLVFKNSIVFITKDDYNKIVGKSKEYYVIKSGKDYEIFRENKIEYVDYNMFQDADVYVSEYNINDRYSKILNNIYIYDYSNLFKINHETKTIELLMKNCEMVKNKKYMFFIGKNEVIQVLTD